MKKQLQNNILKGISMIKKILITSLCLFFFVSISVFAEDDQNVIIDYFNSISGMVVSDQDVQKDINIYQFGKVMWLFKETKSDGTIFGFWKNAPVINKDGLSEFKDIYIDNDKLRNYDGYQLNRKYLDALLGFERIEPENLISSLNKSSINAEQSNDGSAQTEKIIYVAAPPELLLKKSKKITGLIIDASNINLKECREPNIVTSDNNILYGYDSDFYSHRGMEYGELIRYAGSLDEALNDKIRVGENPLIINATGASGPFKCNAVISDSDSEKIKIADEISKILRSNSVTIVK